MSCWPLSDSMQSGSPSAYAQDERKASVTVTDVVDFSEIARVNFVNLSVMTKMCLWPVSDFSK